MSPAKAEMDVNRIRARLFMLITYPAATGDDDGVHTSRRRVRVEVGVVVPAAVRRGVDVTGVPFSGEGLAREELDHGAKVGAILAAPGFEETRIVVRAAAVAVLRCGASRLIARGKSARKDCGV